jgi:hypothetical protein
MQLEDVFSLCVIAYCVDMAHLYQAGSDVVVIFLRAHAFVDFLIKASLSLWLPAALLQVRIVILSLLCN